MTSTPSNKILEYFPHKTIDPIIGQPTFQDIFCVHYIVNKNAVSVRLNLGGGKFGMLGLTLSPRAYAVLSPTLFFSSPHPGAAPVFPHAANGPQISNICHVFAEEDAVYQ